MLVSLQSIVELILCDSNTWMDLVLLLIFVFTLYGCSLNGEKIATMFTNDL